MRPPGRPEGSYRGAEREGTRVGAAPDAPATSVAVAHAMLLDAVHTLAESSDPQRLYRTVEFALEDLVGFRLFTLLRATPARDALRREYSSDAEAYPASGVKPIARDRWLQRLMIDARPVLSPDADAVRRNFPDAEQIFALGCQAVLNVPVQFQGRILGSMNLLHETGRFDLPRHAPLCRPFALLVGAAWAASGAQPATTR